MSELTPNANGGAAASAHIVGTKTPGVFRFVSLGDVHLGHHQTPTRLILKNLRRFCTNDEMLRDLDMLIITGDLFDRQLVNGDEQVHEINRWITELLYRCARHDVAIRVVEGTPSHDRKQSSFFVEQARNINIDVDLHYATTLSVEYIERFGIHVLYVPDKWRPDTQETLDEVRLLLHQKGLEKVDYAIMHGAFEYQLPSIVKEPTHDSEAYLGLVRHLIMIGHVHIPTLHDRILAAGSFDRQVHGDEGAKGFYRVAVHADDDYRITFVENKGAKRYETVDCRRLTTKQVNVALQKTIDALPKGSSIRIRCEPQDPVLGDLEGYKKRYPHLEWATPVVEREVKQEKTDLDSLLDMDPEVLAPIDPTTISDLVAAELTRHAESEDVRRRCQHRLSEFV